MYITNQNFIPLQTIFGAGYVAEQHSDCGHLPTDDREARFTDFVKLLGALIWGEATQAKH
jgi:hypothetical protein